MDSGGKYISGQKGYGCEKKDTVPVVVIDEEKEKAFKTGYITLYTKFLGVCIRNGWEKNQKAFYIPGIIVCCNISCMPRLLHAPLSNLYYGKVI